MCRFGPGAKVNFITALCITVEPVNPWLLSTGRIRFANTNMEGRHGKEGKEGQGQKDKGQDAQKEIIAFPSASRPRSVE